MLVIRVIYFEFILLSKARLGSVSFMGHNLTCFHSVHKYFHKIEAVEVRILPTTAKTKIAIAKLLAKTYH